MLQRVLKFAEVWFEPIPEPRSKDWLSLHPELMQTFDAFRSAFDEYRRQMGPTSERQCLHLLPLGPGEPEPALFAQLRDICAAFFWPLRVAVLRMPEAIPESFEPDGSIDADEVLSWMASGLRANSALTVALTEAPLRSGGVTTIGASDWAARVGVFSIHKYVPLPSPHAELDRDDLPLAFERIVKLVTHEAVHMFGVLHCCYFRCLMNGSSSIEEVDTKPPYLCGMCLKKLHLVLGFDPLERYLRLAAAWATAEREDIAKWYEARVAIVQSTLAGCRASSPQQPHLAWPRSQSRTSVTSVRPQSSMSAGVAPMLRTAQRGAERAQSSGRYRSPSPTPSGPTPTLGASAQCSSPPLMTYEDVERSSFRSHAPRPPETAKPDEKRRPAPNMWWSTVNRDSSASARRASPPRASSKEGGASAAASPQEKATEREPSPSTRSQGQEEFRTPSKEADVSGEAQRGSTRSSQAQRRGSISSALADIGPKEELLIQRKWDAIASQQEREAYKVTPSRRSRLSMRTVELESIGAAVGAAPRS